MLNKENQRELCYLVRVDEIRPIEGRDRVECAVVGGWTCMVRKGQFKPGDLGIYFEIDSKVDETQEVFAFTAKYGGKIKTQKFKTPSGQFWSQGLLMHPSDFGWKIVPDAGFDQMTVDAEGNYHTDIDETRFLTKQLGVTYAVAEDNARKANSNDKYQKMARRNPKLAKTKIWRWLYRRDWGKKVLFMLFGRPRDKKGGWPSWVVKTDEERIQNLPYLFANAGSKWMATEKIDGSSTTFTMRGRGRKKEFYVCSRNVVLISPTRNASMKPIFILRWQKSIIWKKYWQVCWSRILKPSL